MVSTLAAAAVNVACLHLTIRWIGAQAASLALLLGFAACIVIRQAILKKETGAKISVFPFFLFFRRPAWEVSGICIFRLWQAGEFLLWIGRVRAVLLFVSGFAQKPAAKRQSLPDTAEGGKKASGSRE